MWSCTSCFSVAQTTHSSRDNDTQQHPSCSSSESAPPFTSGHLLGKEHALARLTDKYEVKQIIGSGAFAKTRLCVEKGTCRHFAVKSIDKEALSRDERKRVRREMQCMYHLAGHPNICRLEDAYEDETHVHLVMELCTGGELVKHIMDKGTYTERDAAFVMRSLLEAVAYAHDMGVTHRDIKIDNLLMLNASPDSPIKLVDWGFSTFLKPGEKLKKLCGTVYSLAPEVVAGCYDERADVWSCGVVLYVMLAGRLPFNGRTPQEVLKTIASEKGGLPDMSCAPWPSISEAAKSAVRAMMTRDPDKRPSARDMLQHEWIREHGEAGENEIEPEVLHRIKSFATMAKLKQHAALVIARHLPQDQIRGLRVLFDSMDKDHTGAITAEKLRQALEDRMNQHHHSVGSSSRGSSLRGFMSSSRSSISSLKGSSSTSSFNSGATHVPPPSKEELQDILEHADLHGCGCLDCAEFLAAELHQSRLAEEENMMLAFKHFDRDGDGCISADEVRRILMEAGEPEPSNDEVKAIISQVDENGDGGIDWKEFVHMMVQQSEEGSLSASRPPSHSGKAARSAAAAAALSACDNSVDQDDGYYDLY